MSSTTTTTTTTSTISPKRYAMLVRVDLCIGCKICTNACKDEFEDNDYLPYSAAQPESQVTYGPSFYPAPSSPLTVSVQPGQEWISVVSQVAGKYPSPVAKYIPMPCMQCSNAPCQAAALNKAIYTRPDGIVIIDPDLSTEQTQIAPACPYSKIFFNTNGQIPQKCTFCAHLLDQGQTEPKCVASCPVGALVFGDMSVSSSPIAQQVASLGAVQLHPEYGTKPNVYYVGL
ncbi:MAG: 4Fe-4S dicluster domain-containing protein [Nitrososphaerales archaeon]|jgi:Fe-S-cluster-containing dehydrogenase component